MPQAGDTGGLLRRMRQPGPRHAPLQVAGLGGSLFQQVGVIQRSDSDDAGFRDRPRLQRTGTGHRQDHLQSLRQRGDLTICVSEEAQSVWSAPRRTSQGGQWRYSDLAIETCLTLRTTYRLALRQTQGLMGSIGTLMGLDIRVPDYSTLSRRANGLSIAQAMRQAGSVAVHLVVDSTGLKIFGEGEWLAQGNMPPLARTPPRTGPGQRCDCLRRSDSR